MEIDSYCLVKNIYMLDEIIKHNIKQNLDNYIEENKIFEHNHYGSRKSHGTNTALAQISHEENTRYENGEVFYGGEKHVPARHHCDCLNQLFH